MPLNNEVVKRSSEKGSAPEPKPEKGTSRAKRNFEVTERSLLWKAAFMAMTDPRCHLLGGLFAIFIQVSLALVAVATLIVKRQYEHPRRDWYVWFLDIGKQGIGSAVGHFANIYLSQFIAYQVPDADECQWYCFTYIVDCTVGLGMNIAFLRIFEKCLLNCKDPEHNIVIFGDYGDPPNIMKWLLQLGIWLTIVVSVKIIILSLLIHILLPINTIIAYIFVVFVPWPEVELILVMILIPAGMHDLGTIAPSSTAHRSVGMNVLQFWITDTFLQRHDLAHKPTLVLDLDEELLDEVLYHSALLNTFNIANLLPYCRTRRSQGGQALRCTASGYEVSILSIRLMTMLCSALLCFSRIFVLCLFSVLIWCWSLSLPQLTHSPMQGDSRYQHILNACCSYSGIRACNSCGLHYSESLLRCGNGRRRARKGRRRWRWGCCGQAAAESRCRSRGQQRSFAMSFESSLVLASILL